MRDSKNLLLLLVSVGLMGTWIYHLYDKSRYSNHLAQVLVKDTMATQEAIRDSLQKLFAEKTLQLDTTKSVTDSLRGSLDSTMSKIFGLRRQISRLEALEARTLAAGDVADEHGTRSAGAWLAHETRQDPSAGRVVQRLAEGLDERCRSLPRPTPLVTCRRPRHV